MTKPTAQQCHALTTYFISAHTEKVGVKPSVNRNKSRWGFESMLMDYTPGQARELIDYYLDHYDEPNIEWFLYNYEKVDAAKMEREANSLSVNRRRQETERRLKEWRERWQN